jgi:argininosuccinate lyase
VHSLGRDKERMLAAYGRINQNPLGACAVSGTSCPINRGETARLLAFDSVQENELDTISSRGECETELLSALSLAMCKLSRLSEELIWLSQKRLVSIAEEHTTGSSMMPNKKNPDVLELIRGRAGRVYGNLVHSLSALKGLMSGYNSDMQETKYALIAGIETAIASVDAMAMVVEGLKFNTTEIEGELEAGFAQATEIADYLAMGGMPFREAHERTGALVKYCESRGITLSCLGHADAGRLLGARMDKKAWEGLLSFKRERLRRLVRHVHLAGIRSEKEKISQAFRSLLA